MSVLVALIAMTGFGDVPAQAQPQPQAAQQKAPEKKICKSETITGSRMGVKKVCATKEQWEARSEEYQDLADHRMSAPQGN